MFKLIFLVTGFLFYWLGSKLSIAGGRYDLDSGVDRLFYYAGQGHMIGLPTRPGTSSAATTGVPTNGIQGFMPGAHFINFRGTVGSVFYVNTGTFASATWTNVA